MVTRRDLARSYTLKFAGVLAAITFSAAALSAAGPVTYIKTYANFIPNTTEQKNVVPEGVQATFDGGYILMASTDCSTESCIVAQGNTNPIVDWLVKTDSSGNPQWKKELGCLNSPGGYSIGVSLQQTTDGGYVVGGGGVGSGFHCANGAELQLSIVERLNAGGDVTWSKDYSIGRSSGLNAIRQTADGGFVGAGGVYTAAETPSGGLVLKLDASGNVEWQSVIGPLGQTTVVFNAIQQASDGGYVAAGNSYVLSSRCQPFECEGGLVVKIDSSGKVQWQRALSAAGSNSLFLDSLVATSDGGYVAAGAWSGNSQAGGLLVKLDSTGNILWQNAYSGGSDYGDELGVVIYSVHQTDDGGYFLAGDGNVVLAGGEIELVPWLGKVDSNGNVLWHYFYYQVDNGLSLSEYFAGGDVAKDGGFIAAGWTEDYQAQRSLLFVVKTDSSGQCGNCSDVHPDVGLTGVNPGLTISPLSLPVSTSATRGVNSPSKTRSTAIITVKDCS